MITTYAELQTAVASWLKRSDLTALMPDFIALAEEKFNRRLRVRQMEVALAETVITDNLVTIPANVIGVKALWLTGYEAAPLKAQSLESLIASGSTGIATLYAWQNSNWRFNGSGTVQGVLYERIPPLASNSTNWLLTASPTLYLFAALSEASIYTQEADKAVGWSQRADSIIDELHGNNQRDTFSGALTARAR